VQIGLSPTRAVLTLYIAAAALGASALFLIQAPTLIANAAFAGLVLAGLLVLEVFERIEPRLAGDPPLMLIPGGGGLAESVRVAVRLSHEVVLLLAPRQRGGTVLPARAEVIEAVAALAEDPPAVRRLLEQGLGQAWWENFDSLNQALRLNGHVRLALPEPGEALPAPNPGFSLAGNAQPEVLAAVLRAQLILLGPGDPEVNLVPVLVAPGLRQALLASRGLRLWVGAEASQPVLDAWLGQPTTTAAAARWESDVQAQLLRQASGHVKTQIG